MREQPRGDLVFISSVAAQHVAARSAPYTMAKVALEALALTLAKEGGPRDHANVVAPGLVDTEMGRRLVKGMMGSGDIARSTPRPRSAGSAGPRTSPTWSGSWCRPPPAT